MDAEAPKHHGHTGGTQDPSPVPEPSHAERARTLLARTGEGTLATRSRRRPGFPFASLMPFALDTEGHPLILVSGLAVHTQNLKKDDRASLLVREPQSEDRDALGLARVTLMGRTPEVPDGAVEEARGRYLSAHPNARYWVDYPDFSFRRMEVEEVYYVGGFGVMGWVSAEEFAAAEPDPLLGAAPGILDHMNTDHVDAMILLARHKGVEQVEDARMTSVDRLGYQLRIQTADGTQGLRIAFPQEVRSATAVREALVAQVRRARGAAAS